MKKNISEEMLVRFEWTTLIDDNALIIYRQNEEDKDKVDICLRYVEHNSIKDQFLITLPREKMFRDFIEVNEDNTAIAIYEEKDNQKVLSRVYKIEDHSFGIPEFLDLEYKQLFPPRKEKPKVIRREWKRYVKY